MSNSASPARITWSEVSIGIGARSVIACHVMNFAYYYGANAKWNPERNRFASGGNNRWLTRDKYRAGWSV